MQKIFLVCFVISIFGILDAAEMSIDISEKIDISSDNIEIKEGKIEFKNNVIFLVLLYLLNLGFQLILLPQH